MYGGNPYSELPYSASGSFNDLRVYFDMTMDVTAALTLKVYVSTAAGDATFPTDILPNQPFRDVLQSFQFTRSIMQGDIGQFTTGTGSIVISNADANYDFLPASYAIDGRAITVKIGDRNVSYDQWFPLARVTAKTWRITTSSIEVPLVDYSYKLEVPMQPNTYGGTGAADGTADIAGKRKSLVLGYCPNIPLLQVVPGLLIYQAHDGSLQSVDAVYDKASALTYSGTDVASYAALAALAVSASQYSTCKALGLIKLGSIPAGTVTADVHGENGSGYIEKTADIVQWAVLHRTTLVAGDLFASSFTALNASQPAPIGYFIGPDDNITVAAFVANVMSGVGGWGGHRLDGSFEVRRFEAPSGTPVQSFTRADMVGQDIQREPLPDAYDPPRSRWRVPYARNWTVQTTDIAAGVSAARRGFLAEQDRLAQTVSATILLDHPFAQDRDPVTGYFQNQSDAAAEAARLPALFKTTRAIYRFPAPRRALRLDLGDVIQVTHPRFDLSQGRLMTIVEIKVNVQMSEGRGLDTVEIAAYG